MPPRQNFHILHHNGDPWSWQPNTGRILGIFITLPLAITAVEKHIGMRVPTHCQPNMLEYFCTDGRIRVVTTQLEHQSVVSGGDTNCIVVEVAEDMVLGAEPCTSEDEAWDTCLRLKAMRGGDKWVREKGLRHVGADHDGNTIWISRHHWCVDKIEVNGQIQK
jgi:hypothetical protein